MQVTGGQTYSFPDYTYDLSGALVAQTYPSGRIVRTESDNLGRLSKVTSQKAGDFERTQLSQLAYTSFGAVSNAKLGNGRWENAQFDNKRLQIKQIGLGASAGDTTFLKLEYNYGTTDNNGSGKSVKKVKFFDTFSFAFHFRERFAEFAERGQINEFPAKVICYHPNLPVKLIYELAIEPDLGKSKSG